MKTKNLSFNIFLAIVIAVSILTVVLTFTTTEAEKVLPARTDSVSRH